MRHTLLCVILLAAFGCTTTTGPTENTVNCKTYLATEHNDRTRLWANTFRSVLEYNPNLGRAFWSCMLSTTRVEAADIALGITCRGNPELDFTVAVVAQLEKQFQKCGLTFNPPQPQK